MNKIISVGILSLLILTQIASTMTIISLKQEVIELRRKLTKHEEAESNFDRFYQQYTKHPLPRE